MNQTNANINVTQSNLPLPLINSASVAYYQDLSISVSLFKNFEDKAPQNLRTDWGTFLTLLSIDDESRNSASNEFPGYTPWTNSSSIAETDKTNMLVIDFNAKFDIEQLAPQFRNIERASYSTHDPRTGDELFRVILPLLTPLSVASFIRLKPTIQKWIDGDGDHPSSNPVSYEIGRFCSFQSYRKRGHTGLQVDSVSPGWLLNESALDELMNTGTLTLT